MKTVKGRCGGCTELTEHYVPTLPEQSLAKHPEGYRVVICSSCEHLSKVNRK